MGKRVFLLCGMAVWWWSSASAQIPVTDVGNLSQNALQTVQSTLTAVRAQISNVNEVSSLNNQLQSLANEARQLASLPMNLVNEISTTIGEYTSVLNQGRGIAYQVQSSVAQFEALYAQGLGGSGSLMQRAAAMLGQMRQAGLVATQATAVFDRLCAQQTRVQQLLGASAGAQGQLQAQQANNQLLGVLADQQASLQEVLAATGRLQISEAMQQMVQQEQAKVNMDAFLAGMATQPAFSGRGNGFRLPE